MDLTISIPEDTSEEAQRMANEMNISLDQLFTLAVNHYLSVHHGELLTGILDTVYKDEPSTLDPELLKLQSATLGLEKW